MLEMLVRNRGKLVGREELLREVGPAYAKETHYLQGVSGAAAPQLEADPAHPCTCSPKAGMGYRFQV